VTAVLRRRPYERSQGNIRGYRNGHRERQVSCGAGSIEIPVPRVSDTEETFRSQLLEGWQRRSKLLEETIPLLYVEGLSTRDFKRALKPLWGKSGLSRSSVSRANKALKEAFAISMMASTGNSICGLPLVSGFPILGVTAFFLATSDFLSFTVANIPTPTLGYLRSL